MHGGIFVFTRQKKCVRRMTGIIGDTHQKDRGQEKVFLRAVVARCRDHADEARVSSAQRDRIQAVLRVETIR